MQHSSSLLRLSAISWVCMSRSLAFPPAYYLNIKPALATITTASKHTELVYHATSRNDENADIIPNFISESQLLCDKAKTFVQYKNAAGRGDASLDPVFDMCCPTTVDLYGLRGDNVRSGLTSFFDGHPELHHELTEEPTLIGPLTVQYPFIKTWRKAEDGEIQQWSSIDASKPRNKMERLDFNKGGLLTRVSIVEVTEITALSSD
mmetsp:Transcript_34627/g.41790  ORF Transcript_34627/g.41790 Transcript_34627/m.41790 type:complete len:206 (-) Transcript_34627:162-779(-)